MCRNIIWCKLTLIRRLIYIELHNQGDYNVSLINDAVSVNTDFLFLLWLWCWTLPMTEVLLKSVSCVVRFSYFFSLKLLWNMYNTPPYQLTFLVWCYLHAKSVFQSVVIISANSLTFFLHSFLLIFSWNCAYLQL